MKGLLPAALAALALSLTACSDPGEAYTPVDELPSAEVPPNYDAGTAPVSGVDRLDEPVPVDPLPAPTDPENPPMDPVPPPMDDARPIDDATRPPPVDPTMDDEPVSPVDPR